MLVRYDLRKQGHVRTFTLCVCLSSPSDSSVRDQCSEVLQFVCHDWGNRRLLGERRRPAGAGLASTDPFLLLVAMQQQQQRAQVCGCHDSYLRPYSYLFSYIIAVDSTMLRLFIRLHLIER